MGYSFHMSREWDAIVVGLGAMGAAALWHLARRGARVLGIERFSRGHDRGSSHGGSRIIRYAYFEHPDYVPLLRRSGELWTELERASQSKLVHQSGVLYGGMRGSEVLAGVKASANQHRIALESIDPHRIGDRFAAFAKCAEPIDEFLFEPGAGFIRPERAICAMIEQAELHGAVVRESTTVESWHESAECAEVVVQGESLRARAIILCPGAWTAEVARSLGVALINTRQVIAWITPHEHDRADARVMPAFFIERESGAAMYGVPMSPDQQSPLGIKVGFHGDGAVCHPDSLDRQVRAQEIDLMDRAVARVMPGVAGSVTDSAVCIYTNTLDGHFIIDRMPGSQRTSIACGFCGHGFKFAPVVGEVLADFAMRGSTALPIDFLRIDRLRGQ